MGSNDQPPKDVGESQSRSGEDMENDDGKEAGREDEGTRGGTDRPAGTSTARDFTGIDPQDPIGEEGPDESKGGGTDG